MKKRIYSAVAVALLVILYIVIFYLSSDLAEESSMKSSAVTRLLVKSWYFLQNGDNVQVSGDYMDLTMLSLEKLVRKLAHFTEYLCMGWLSYSLVLLWWKGKLRNGRLLILMQLLLSASLDEFHQFFVPGRNASVKDVLIDSLGGITGMILIEFILRAKRRLSKVIQGHPRSMADG